MTTKDLKTVTFSMQEVAKILLKEKGIKKGHYIAHISPNLKGTIVNLSEHEGGDEDEINAEYRQAMIIAFDAIELIEVPEHIPTAIDASQMD